MIALWCGPSCESGSTGVESADDVLEQRAVSTWYFELPVRLLELAECACLSALVSEYWKRFCLHGEKARCPEAAAPQSFIKCRRPDFAQMRGGDDGGSNISMI